MSAIIDRYLSGGRAARLYRRLRLEHGGFAEIAELFPREGLIVDLGCGAGLLAHVLLEGSAGRSVLAVDHAAERIEMLRESAAGLAIEARLGGMEDLELPPCAGIALIDVLHYLEAPAQERLLERCAHALEPGGVIVLRDPDAGAGVRFGVTRLHERIATGLGWTQATVAHFRAGAEWAFLLEAHGLRPEVVPLPGRSPYADRTVWGRKP